MELHVQLLFDFLLETQSTQLREDTLDEVSLVIGQRPLRELEKNRLSLAEILACNLRQEGGHIRSRAVADIGQQR